jgi:hypothetical protein
MQLRRIIGYLQKLLYTVKRIRMSPTPTINIYLFEGPILPKFNNVELNVDKVRQLRMSVVKCVKYN